MNGTGPATAAGTGSCRYCHTTAYGGDADGPAHPCCHAWRKVIQAGYQCPSCQVAHVILAQPRQAPDGQAVPVRLPAFLPPLPQTLPDGSPFVPEVPAPQPAHEPEAGS